VGDVRAPLTTFKELGKEGEARLKKLKTIMRELDELMDRLDAREAPAKLIRTAAE
jgi:4-hydroxy-tetrahydrodipicolinate synthase